MCVIYLCCVTSIKSIISKSHSMGKTTARCFKEGKQNASEIWGDSGLQRWETSAQGDVRPQENKQENLQAVTFQAVCSNTSTTLSSATHWHPSMDAVHATKQNNDRRDPEVLCSTVMPWGLQSHVIRYSLKTTLLTSSVCPQSEDEQTLLPYSRGEGLNLCSHAGLELRPF